MPLRPTDRTDERHVVRIAESAYGCHALRALREEQRTAVENRRQWAQPIAASRCDWISGKKSKADMPHFMKNGFAMILPWGARPRLVRKGKSTLKPQKTVVNRGRLNDVAREIQESDLLAFRSLRLSLIAIAGCD
jgi:hypothetical protein